MSQGFIQLHFTATEQVWTIGTRETDNNYTSISSGSL